MIDSKTRTEIGKFMLSVNEPYDMVQGVSFEGQTEMHAEYVSDLLSTHDATRRGIVSKMIECWSVEQSYERIRDWGRAMIGFATLLGFDTESEAREHWTLVSDAITRIAHWRHSTHPFYTEMNCYADYIATAVWSDLPDLFATFGDADRIVFHQGESFRLNRYGPRNSRINLDANTSDLRSTAELFVDPDETRQLQRDSFGGEVELDNLLEAIRFDRNAMQAF